jgi:hypothetical protein
LESLRVLYQVFPGFTVILASFGKFVIRLKLRRILFPVSHILLIGLIRREFLQFTGFQGLNLFSDYDFIRPLPVIFGCKALVVKFDPGVGGNADIQLLFGIDIAVVAVNHPVVVNYTDVMPTHDKIRDKQRGVAEKDSIDIYGGAERIIKIAGPERAVIRVAVRGRISVIGTGMAIFDSEVSYVDVIVIIIPGDYSAVQVFDKFLFVFVIIPS